MPPIELSVLDRSLSGIMASPSSAAGTSTADLQAYHRHGGNALHLHGEGGEIHSRQATGEWLREHCLRPEFFLCTQICHDDWNDAAQMPIDRFTSEAVHQDIMTDLQLVGTDYLDLVYFDDRPHLPFEPVIEAVGAAIASGRVRSLGVRNFTPARLRAAHTFAKKALHQGISAVVTTELSLFSPHYPLWPEYVPFDTALRQTATELGLTVFAHAGDLTLGQCLFGDEDSLARLRPEWIERWQHPDNAAMASRIQQIAAAQGRTPREIQMAWLLGQPFTVIAIMILPTLHTDSGEQYKRGSQMRLGKAEQQELNLRRFSERYPD